MSRFVSLNGQILPEAEAGLSFFDLGLLRAYAVFDFMTAEDDKLFLYDEHYARIVKTSAFLDIEFPYAKDEFQAVAQNLLKKNGFERSILRTVVTGGVSEDGITPAETPTVAILVYRYDPLPESVYINGAKLTTLDFARTLPEVKTTHYFAAVKHQKQKREAGALEILYTRDGRALEASTSNIFIVKNKKIITPKVGVLPGITRDLVLKLIREAYNIEERDVSLDELFSADEVFLTASGKDVVPVVDVDGKGIASGVVGPITKDIIKRYRQFYDAYYAS